MGLSNLPRINKLGIASHKNNSNVVTPRRVTNDNIIGNKNINPFVTFFYGSKFMLPNVRLCASEYADLPP